MTLLGLALARAIARRATAAAGLAAIAVLLVVCYSLVQTVPAEVVFITPYVSTLLVLALAAQRLQPPAAVGLPYRRGTGSG